MMIELLPDYVTPKVHFITEYPRSIEKYGLPILNSCIRFEAKHLYFKQIVNRTFNFKNPLFTLLKRHQLRRCLLSDSNRSTYSPSMIIRSSKSVDLFELAIPVQLLLNQYINQTDSVFEYEDIDGETLVLLQNNDMMHIFPRIKDRVKFIDLRSKLISNQNEEDENNNESTGVSNENTKQSSSVSNEAKRSSNDIDPMTDPDPSSNIVCYDDDNDDALTKATLPIDYEVPQLTVRMQHHIDDNNISKFNPHTTLRGELLSILFDDVTTSHQLFYPTNKRRDWHESIKQKFKRERKPLQMVHNFVQAKQDKYGKTKGRPKQKSAILQAERKIKDTPMINLADKQNENLLSIVNNMNMELLKDKPDNDTLNDLWAQSFNIRRLCIRELSIDEILERFPAYRRPELILAEVKDTVGVDINKNTNDLLPHFFDCIPDNSCFLSDVLPFRVVRVLCKIFGDPVGNIFTHEDILVPYPCIKISDDKFELYVDFHLIKFAHHNRCCRLLYSVLLEDSRHLNKSLKCLLNDWKYTIINQPLIKRQALITSLVQNLTQSSIINRNISTPSNTSNRIAGESLEEIDDNEEFDDNKRSSSHLKIISSNTFNQVSANELSENNENTASSSDDEDDPYRLSIATPPTSTAEDERSRAILATPSTPPVTMKKLSNNTKSTRSTTISFSKKLASVHQQENAVDKIQQRKKHSSTGYTKT
ncbi:unnamed protein product [Rotaria socialis]|uniref:Uncharacterized protein n=2 Tax=Rotaria socialis TaxID=392032 RepID=A0A821ARD6_9BILA|nr:unnamed protein product [Rotaria socialis]